MNWELVSAITGITALVLTLFLEWPHIKKRIYSSLKSQKQNFILFFTFISIMLHVCGIFAISLSWAFALLFTTDPSDYNIIFWWGWVGMVTGISGSIFYWLVDGTMASKIISFILFLFGFCIIVIPHFNQILYNSPKF